MLKYSNMKFRLYSDEKTCARLATFGKRDRSDCGSQPINDLARHSYSECSQNFLIFKNLYFFYLFEKIRNKYKKLYFYNEARG